MKVTIKQEGKFWKVVAFDGIEILKCSRLSFAKLFCDAEGFERIDIVSKSISQKGSP